MVLSYAGDDRLGLLAASLMNVGLCSPYLLTSCAGSHGRYLAKLSSVGSISEEETCEKLKGLIQRQVQMCKRNLEVMDSVRRGAQLAIEECQYQFRNRRWNCSTLDTLPVFGKVVTQGELGLEGTLSIILFQPFALGQGASHPIRLCWAGSKLALTASRMGHPQVL